MCFYIFCKNSELFAKVKMWSLLLPQKAKTNDCFVCSQFMSCTILDCLENLEVLENLETPNSYTSQIQRVCSCGNSYRTTIGKTR